MGMRALGQRSPVGHELREPRIVGEQAGLGRIGPDGRQADLD